MERRTEERSGSCCLYYTILDLRCNNTRSYLPKYSSSSFVFIVVVRVLRSGVAIMCICVVL